MYVDKVLMWMMIYETVLIVWWCHEPINIYIWCSEMNDTHDFTMMVLDVATDSYGRTYKRPHSGIFYGSPTEAIMADVLSQRGG